MFSFNLEAFFMVVMVMGEVPKYEFGPCGVKQCEEFCCQLAGRPSCAYSRSTLKCRQIDEKQDTRAPDEIILNQASLKCPQDPDISCPGHSRLIRTRTKGDQCVRYIDRSDPEIDEETGRSEPNIGRSEHEIDEGIGRSKPNIGRSDHDIDEGIGRSKPNIGRSDHDIDEGIGRSKPNTGRSDHEIDEGIGRSDSEIDEGGEYLLIAPHSERYRSKFRLLNLKTNVVETRTFWERNEVEITDIVYSSRLNSVIISQLPGNISLINLPSKEEKVLSLDFTLYNIGMDDINDYIFVICLRKGSMMDFFSSSVKLMRLHSNGSSQKIIHTVKKVNQWDLSVDPFREMFVISMPRMICIGNYEGVVINEIDIASGSEIRLTLDCIGNTLYYATQNKLFQRPQPGNNKSAAVEILTVNCPTFDMIYHSNQIYMSCRGDMNIHRINPASRQVKTLETDIGESVDSSLITILH